MKLRAVRPSAIGAVDTIVVPLGSDGTTPAGLARAVKTVVERIAKAEVGAGRLYGVTTQHAEPRIVVVGMGKASELGAERARNIAAAGIKSLWRSNARRVAIFVPAGALDETSATQAAAEGAVFAVWRPEVHRTREEEKRLPPSDSVLLITAKPQTDAIARGQAIGEATNFQRTLANEPANKMTPTIVAEQARAMAKRAGIPIEVLDAERCRALGMGSYLSVAQGSHEPPKFIVLRYKGRGGKGYDLGLVGKGITFDSGGISIKPADNMHHMKGDMAGAASVIAAIGAIAELKPKVNVIAVA